MAEIYEKYPVLICPLSGELPFLQHEDVQSYASFDRIMEAQLTQRALPVIGLPAMAVATGTVGKIPVGVQLIAGRFREDILLSAGADIEKAGPKMKIADLT